MKKRILPIIGLSLFAWTTVALGQANFRDTVTFGNSLTHNDLLWIVYGSPPALYGADPVEAVFDKGAIAGDELVSYAVAGSESGDVTAQVDLYELLRFLNLQDPATLFGFEIGSNDVLNNIGLLSTFGPGEDPSADAVIDNIIDSMRTNVTRLRSSHPSAEFIVWQIPDVTLTPDLWNQLTAEEIANVHGHIERVNRLVRNAGARLDFMVALDTFTLLQEIVGEPPVFFGHALVPPPAWGDFDHIFADEIHPTAVSNAMLANEIILQINTQWNDDIPFYSDEELAGLAHIPFD